MNVAEKINQYVEKLPEKSQAEVLDFVEFLLNKSEQAFADRQRQEWTKGSLLSAMRGIDQETEPTYTSDDIKEHFS